MSDVVKSQPHQDSHDILWWYHSYLQWVEQSNSYKLLLNSERQLENLVVRSLELYRMNRIIIYLINQFSDPIPASRVWTTWVALNGPRPAAVWAATVISYLVKGFRLDTVTYVPVTFSWVTPSNSMSTTLTVYLVIMPFWYSSYGGCQLIVKLWESVFSMVMFCGAELGTTESMQNF